ncbi:glycoside hydrolase family 32 protein [Rhodophyticola sp. CCM32]|uniref:glycoside hydrolase family 32 protein n=1 Tax=Rhodophyticola sp. CCM32 TaxID=2916397 RepID=UPI00143CCA7F|nr:glycoside hydrolase family 32 protein [Rhodophyticola sp. CCM32]
MQLHAWIGPRGSGTAELSMHIPPLDTVGLKTTETGITAVHYICDTAGAAQLKWNRDDTDCRAIYVFDPATVTDKGIEILYVDPITRRSNPNGPAGFRPPFGWMNDPNGFCYHDGCFHLFYQFNPTSLAWDRMHWGHAVSKDLYTWTDLPVILFPDPAFPGDGGAFSGSSWPAEGAGLDLFFTHHRHGADEVEVQCRARTSDLVGIDAEPEVLIDARPADARERMDFRDPFITRGPDGRLYMVLAGRNRAEALLFLYRQAEDESWDYQGVLYSEPRFGGVAAECPVLLPFGDPQDAGTSWLLIFSLLGSRSKVKNRRNVTLALVGRFDGVQFTPDLERELDHGPHFYAFQACNSPEGIIGLGWVANWSELHAGKKLESGMTWPRQLALLDAPDGSRQLSVLPYRIPGDGPTLDIAANDEPVAIPAADILEIKLSIPKGNDPLHMTLGGDIDLDLILSERSLIYRCADMDQRELDVPFTGVGGVRVLLHHGTLEIFDQAGEWSSTLACAFYGKTSHINIAVSGKAQMSVAARSV